MTGESSKALRRFREDGDPATNGPCPECGGLLIRYVPVLSKLDKAYLQCEDCARKWTDDGDITLTSVENATERVWVMASPEILAEMRRGWGPALQIKATVNANGSWELWIRAKYNERGEVIDWPADTQ